MSPVLGVLVWVATAIVGLAMLVATSLVLRGPDDATRAVAADLVYFCALALFALTVLRTGSSVALDVLMLGSLLGVLSTVALARILTRGRR